MAAENSKRLCPDTMFRQRRTYQDHKRRKDKFLYLETPRNTRSATTQCGNSAPNRPGSNVIPLPSLEMKTLGLSTTSGQHNTNSVMWTSRHVHEACTNTNTCGNCRHFEWWFNVTLSSLETQTSGYSKNKEKKIVIVIEFCMASDNLSLTPDSACMVRITRLTTTINTIILAYFTQTHFNIILVTLSCNFNRLRSDGTHMYHLL